LTREPQDWRVLVRQRGLGLVRTDVPNGVHPGQGVHVGPDPAAREDANRKLAAFLREMLAR